MTVYIYDLSDPRTGEIRYIGKSVNPKERLATHVREARKGDVVHCRRWIAGLLLAGLRPALGVLQECVDNDEANEAERFWIGSFRLMGAKLTNKTSGGDGQTAGYKPGADTIEKLRAAKVGRKMSDAARANVKAAFNTPEMKARRRQIVEELKQNNPEWLAKVRVGRTGQKMSEEAKRKIAASWTPERKAKHAAEKSAQPVDERWRAQLSAALKARWDKHKARKCLPTA